jgi:diphthine-ammonia ligase
MKAFMSWSGGKDASLACYKAMQDADVEVVWLLNMISEDGSRSRTHGIHVRLLQLQAESMSLPIVQRRTTWETYEAEFKAVVADLRKEGIRAGVFGDIDLQEHRDWVERVCQETQIEPIFPLWQRKREELLSEFRQAGFEAIVVATRADLLGSEWLGRKIDAAFVEDLKKEQQIDLCGEAGEYHTFVVSGPIFHKTLNILNTKPIERDNHWMLEILDYELTANREGME